MILLITVFVLLHVAAFLYFGRTWYSSMPLPFISSMYWSHARRIGNELIIPVEPIRGVPFFRAVDLATGEMRDTNLPFLPPFRGILQADDRLWFVYNNDVVEYDGSMHVVHKPVRTLTSQNFTAFLFDERPAIFELDSTGVKYRLLVFEDGDWHERGEVGIPGAGRTWRLDEAKGFQIMEPCTGCAISTATPPTFYLSVLKAGDKCHLILRDKCANPSRERFVLYRKGIDFIQSQSDVASAVSPENVPADTFGWTVLDFMNSKWDIAFADHEHLIVGVWSFDAGHSIEFWERDFSNTTNQTPFQLVGNLQDHTPVSFDMGFVRPSKDGPLYFFREQRLRRIICEYQQGSLKEVTLHWDSQQKRIVRWVGAILVQLFAILAVGQLLLIAAVEWVLRSSRDQYEFGVQTAKLASIWRRCVAKGIDLTLVLSLAAYYANQYKIGGLVEFVDDLWCHVPFSKTAMSAAILQSAGWAVAVSLGLVITQATWEITPGKWLCGIRVKRSTLRSCGFARSLLRELTFVLDAPLLLTIVPGIASMFTSEQRQRIGDRLADTVVIEAN